MPTPIDCPRCRRHTVSVLDQGAATTKTRCSSCGWEGPKCFGQHWDPHNQKCQGGADPTNWEDGSHVRPKCKFEHTCREAQDQRSKAALTPMMSALSRPKQQVEVTGGTSLQVPQATTVTPPRQLAAPAPATAPAQQGLRQQPAAQTALAQQMQQMRQRQQQLQQQLQQAQQQAQRQTITQRQTPMMNTTPHQAQMQQMQQPAVHAPQAGTAMAWVPPQQAAMPAYVPQNYPQPGMQVPAYLTVPEPMEQGIASMFANSCLRAAFKGMFHTAANLMDHVAWGGYPAPPPPQGPGGTGAG